MTIEKIKLYREISLHSKQSKLKTSLLIRWLLHKKNTLYHLSDQNVQNSNQHIRCVLSYPIPISIILAFSNTLCNLMVPKPNYPLETPEYLFKKCYSQVPPLT